MSAALRRAWRERPWLPLAAILVLWAAVPVAIAAVHVIRHGGALTGTDAAIAGADQQQYLAAIRESGEHLLIANPFRIGASAHVYLNPMYLISGVLWRLGLDLRASLLLWGPVAAIALAIGVVAYTRRLLGPRGQWPAALLAAFFFSPVLPALAWSGVPLSAHSRAALLLTSGEAMPGWQLWGYLHTVIVLGLMPLCLLGVEQALRPERSGAGHTRRFYLLWASGAGSIIGWLHPWQGVVVLGILAGLAAWRRLERRVWILVLPALATAAPMLYLFLLSHADLDWRLFTAQNRAFHAPLWVLLAALAPLVIPALAGIRRSHDDGQRMLLLWPLASLVAYFAVPQFPFHALQGISIPLSVLAIRGYQRLSLPVSIGAACLAILTVPGLVYELDTFRINVEHRYAPYWLAPGESGALRYLARSPFRGGVLARYYLGMTVPSFTGRSVWVGHYVWTPDFAARAKQAERLFNGELSPSRARAFVRSTEAVYVLTDCQSGADLAPLLGPLVRSSRTFGCASVYQVRP